MFQPLAAAALAATLATLPAVAAAQSAPPAGRLLASNCFQCHGTNGKGPGFDRLAGKSASEIYEELVEFKLGREDEGGLMSRHAQGYTDAQLHAIAQYLSTLR
ncbi:c-type cytochrome [Rubrivivax gelatinosus]|uniref:Cytochrome c553 n=1 Tax=Rubrivivax gelatinosus TaxID=28068 RepID=A0A4R2MDB8_RUBGE|nr:c-type cytochrome [Rubrivivax gelatinosus]MBK1686423.1 hypothetical protein [Rubrivivax gelatinosus]TCP04351.1 cytochrome c553 [Rubrivivax gelatinosus]